MPEQTSLSYRDAGVDIDAGNALIERIKHISKRTHIPGVMGGLGGFGGLFALQNYQDPVLVSGTDGVGTKLLLAQQLGQHDHIGIDLVAMCVNDILVTGAKPLFFLDYFACGQLNVDTAEAVIRGIGQGCEQAGCALIGGETAEMPGMYAPGHYDLAGFAVGAVERNAIIDGSQVQEGDTIIGLASSGPHANGYSLIRKILQHSGASLDTMLDGNTLGDILLTPTRIYVKNVLALFAEVRVKALAHITGGGLPENLPRVLPAHLAARLSTQSWSRPAIFDWLQNQGGVTREEMYRTFNCGIGMVIVVGPAHSDMAIALLQAAGESAMRIGEVVARQQHGVELID